MSSAAAPSGPFRPCTIHKYVVSRNPASRSITRTCKRCGHMECATLGVIDCVKKDNLRVTFSMPSIINAVMGD